MRTRRADVDDRELFIAVLVHKIQHRLCGVLPADARQMDFFADLPYLFLYGCKKGYFHISKFLAKIHKLRINTDR